MYDSLIPLLYGPGASSFEAARYFENEVVNAFRNKLDARISVPTYPQLRDMNETFLDQLSGIRKEKQGWVVTGPLYVSSDRLKIPEVEVVRRNSFATNDSVDGPIRLRVCITGPYTLSSFFPKRDSELFTNIGRILSRFAAENTFSSKDVVVQILAIDEPVLGFLSDSLLDPGSDGREELMAAWECICREAKVRGAEPLIHLHDTSTALFWEVEGLKHIESHVGDALYQSSQVRSQCERYDKFIKASIAITDFEYLVRRKVSETSSSKANLPEVVAKTWTAINKGKIDSADFLDSKIVMKKRLEKIIDLFGVERVVLAGPECGLKSFPTRQCAVEYLRQIAEVTSTF